MIVSKNDLERTILSTMLSCDLTPDNRIAKFKLNEIYFSHPLHKAIVRAIKKLQDKNYPPLDVYVQELLKIERQDDQTKDDYLYVIAAIPFATLENLEITYQILRNRYNQQILKALK